MSGETIKTVVMFVCITLVLISWAVADCVQARRK